MPQRVSSGSLALCAGAPQLPPRAAAAIAYSAALARAATPARWASAGVLRLLLGGDELLRQRREVAVVHALGFASSAHVPGAEQEFFHGKFIRKRGEFVPRLYERI